MNLATTNQANELKPVLKQMVEKADLFHELLPSILLPLIRAGHLTKDHLADSTMILRIVVKRRKFAIKRMRWCVAVDINFAENADRLWKSRAKMEAVVLLATALEQSLNGCLRLVLESKGHTPSHVTELIRTQNIEPKLTWFFECSTGVRIPTNLRKQAKRLFDIRNTIVHYKAYFAHPDANEDSYSKIEKSIELLGKIRPYQFYLRFQQFCNSTIRRCDSGIALAMDMTEAVVKDYKPVKNKALHYIASSGKKRQRTVSKP